MEVKFGRLPSGIRPFLLLKNNRKMGTFWAEKIILKLFLLTFYLVVIK